SLGRPERIAQPLVFIRLFHRHNVRILLNTPHAPDTLVLQRLEPAKPSTKDPVDTRSTENNFLVELVLESLMHQHSRKPQLARTHIELVRNLIDMRSRSGFDPETFILRGLDGFRVQNQASLLPSTNAQERGKLPNKYKLSALPTKHSSRNYTHETPHISWYIDRRAESAHVRLRRFSPSRKTLTSECENNYRLAKIINSTLPSHCTCRIWYSGDFGRPTVQGSGHLCFLGVPSVHGGNGDDVVRFSRSLVLYWT